MARCHDNRKATRRRRRREQRRLARAESSSPLVRFCNGHTYFAASIERLGRAMEEAKKAWVVFGSLARTDAT